MKTTKYTRPERRMPIPIAIALTLAVTTILLVIGYILVALLTVGYILVTH